MTYVIVTMVNMSVVMVMVMLKVITFIIYDRGKTNYYSDDDDDDDDDDTMDNGDSDDTDGEASCHMIHV